jgi:hypothetical protein
MCRPGRDETFACSDRIGCQDIFAGKEKPGMSRAFL